MLSHLREWISKRSIFVKVIISVCLFFIIAWHAVFIDSVIASLPSASEYTCVALVDDWKCDLGAWYSNSRWAAFLLVVVTPIFHFLFPSPLFEATIFSFKNLLINIGIGLYFLIIPSVLYWHFRDTASKKRKFALALVVGILAWTGINIVRAYNTPYWCGNLSDADTSTFVHLEYRWDKEVYRDDSYNKDKNSVYYRCSKIEGADPETFEVIQTPYAKDARSVYHETKDLGVDPKTFVLFSNHNSQGNITSEGLARSQDKVFARGEVVLGVDIATFEYLGSLYFKDKNYAYWYDTPIPGADARTFELIQNQISDDARDKNKKYMWGKPDEVTEAGMQ